MKTCFFAVSMLDELWDEKAKDVFLADPFLVHQLKAKGIMNHDFKVGEYSRTSFSDMEDTLDFITKKRNLYLSLLAPRLNKLHKTSFSDRFWRRSLGMTFEKYMGLIYDFFLLMEKNYDDSIHTCSVLNTGSYYYPRDMDDLRWFLEHQNFAREFLKSEYLREFYPQDFSEVVVNYKSEYSVREVRRLRNSDPTVGIMGAFFDPVYEKGLLRDSNRNIDLIGFNRELPLDFSEFDFSARIMLSCKERTSSWDRFDRFDRFFFRTFKVLFPQVFVEHFSSTVHSMREQFKQYKKLKYIVSEMWIGEGMEPIALALLREERGVKLIYNEHNYSEHPFKASMAPRWADLCDIYAAHGTYGEQIAPNAISLGSLYNFGQNMSKPEQKKYGITFVNGLCFARNAELSCVDASEGYAENASAKFEFKRSFFQALDPSLLSEINYRKYPFDAYASFWEAYYEDDIEMEGYLKGVSKDNHALNGKETIASSKMVVIDYLMTSHLESLSMNVPTIILLTCSKECLAEPYATYLDELIDVGICQTDAVVAAAFIKDVYPRIDSWWSSAKVQRAKNKFLAENIGEPLKFYNFLLQKSEA